MKRNSMPIILSVVLGACACALFAVLLLGGGYAILGSPNRTLLPTNSASVTSPQASSPTSGASSSSAAAAAVKPTFAPSPLNVLIHTDEKISSSAVLSATGGTLTVKSADGTKFTLTFPKGALLGDEKITLTPVTSVDGLPFSGGLVGAVQMAPEGLRLLQPATLTIESPKPVTAKDLKTVAFAYHANGEGLYLNPSDVKGNVLTLEVWHFSGTGGAIGTPAQVQAQQQQNVPSNAEDAFTQGVQEYLERQRESPDPEIANKMRAFLREGYDRFVAPQLPIALNDCEAAPAIFSKALGWARQVDLLGYEKEFQAERNQINDTILQALVNCYNKEYEQCVLDNNKKHLTPMLTYLRQGALLGIEDRFDKSKLEKCPKVSYEASGQVGNGTWSGVVCDLAQPFTIIARPPDLELPFKFVPTSPQGGTASFDVSKFGVHWAGSGTYTVQGSGAEKLKIVGQMTGTYAAAAGSGAYDVPLDIDLTPLGISCKK